MNSPRPSRTLLGLAIVVLIGCSPSPEETPPSTPDTDTSSDSPGIIASAHGSHLRMVTELEAVRAATAETNFYVGDKFLEHARQMVTDSADANASTRLEAQRQLAIAHLRRGEVEDAVRAATSAMELARSASAALEDTQFEGALYDLALAHFVHAERANCAAQHTSESCLFPIGPGGVHTVKEPAQAAMAVLGELLERNPDHLSARWLYNVAAMTLGDWPAGVQAAWRLDPERVKTTTSFPRFRDVASEVGLGSFDLAGGSIVDDLDGDGLLDVMTSCWSPYEPLRIYRNLGNGRFELRPTKATGLEGIFGGQVIVPADFDNDGDLDVFVARGGWLGPHGEHPNSLLRNEGNLRFIDVTFSAGLAERSDPCSTAAWADIDNDGDLDLFVGVESDSVRLAFNQLFRNRGDGTFEDITRAAGIADMGFTKSVAFGDYDGDRFPDLFISNLIDENRLYRNRGDGTFSDVTQRLGVAHPKQSFPAWFFDYDDDGILDLYVSGYASDWKYSGLERVAAWYFTGRAAPVESRLLKGNGKGAFSDVSTATGMRRPTLAMGSNFADVDGDGWVDFYLGTGDPAPDSVMPNVMLRNVGGKRFEEVTYEGGFGHLQKGHGVSFADIDNDGDLDVFHQVGGAFPVDAFSNALFLNPGFGHHWITLELEGRTSNRSAIGARIEVEIETAGTRRTLHRWVNTGGSFGANPLRKTIGLGKADRIVALAVYWPTTDKTERIENVKMDTAYRLVEGTGKLALIDLPALTLPPVK